MGFHSQQFAEMTVSRKVSLLRATATGGRTHSWMLVCGHVPPETPAAGLPPLWAPWVIWVLPCSCPGGPQGPRPEHAHSRQSHLQAPRRLARGRWPLPPEGLPGSGRHRNSCSWSEGHRTQDSQFRRRQERKGEAATGAPGPSRPRNVEAVTFLKESM